jgi:hypothetical protein
MHFTPKKHNVLRYLVARSRNHFCQDDATIRSLFIVGVDVTVNNIKGFSVVMEMQQLVLFALLSNYKMSRSAVNNVCVCVCLYCCLKVLWHPNHIFSFFRLPFLLTENSSSHLVFILSSNSLYLKLPLNQSSFVL